MRGVEYGALCEVVCGVLSRAGGRRKGVNKASSATQEASSAADETRCGVLIIHKCEGSQGMQAVGEASCRSAWNRCVCVCEAKCR